MKLKTDTTGNNSSMIVINIDPPGINTLLQGQHTLRLGGDIEYGRLYGQYSTHLNELKTFDLENVESRSNNYYTGSGGLFTDFNTGVYLELIYTSVDIIINILDINGNIVFTYTINNVTFVNKFTPFSIYWSSIKLKYNSGILYKITDNQSENVKATYETFNTRFNIT